MNTNHLTRKRVKAKQGECNDEIGEKHTQKKGGVWGGGSVQHAFSVCQQIIYTGDRRRQTLRLMIVT